MIFRNLSACSLAEKNKKKTYHLLIMLHTGGAQILMSTNTVIALAIPVKTSGIIPWISSGRNWNFSLIPLVFKLNTSGIPPLFQWNFRSTCKIFHWYMNGNSTFPTVILMEYQRYSSGISKVLLMMYIPVKYSPCISRNSTGMPVEFTGIPMEFYKIQLKYSTDVQLME